MLIKFTFNPTKKADYINNQPPTLLMSSCSLFEHGSTKRLHALMALQRITSRLAIVQTQLHDVIDITKFERF